MNRKCSLILLIIFSLFLLALLSRSAALAWMSLPFICYLGAGLLVSPRQVDLHARRVVNPIRCDSATPIEMTMTIENKGPLIPCLRIREQIQPKIRLIDGPVERQFTLPTGETAGLVYTFQAPRGQYRWEKVWVTVSDPFGLFEKHLELEASAEVIILPEQLPLKRLRLRPRHTLRAPGPNLSRLPGPGVDFFGVRQYHPGDSMRWVHWRLSARHPRLFFTKEFEREEIADIGLILDGRAAADLKFDREDLFEYSIQAAAALAKALLRMGNRVSLLTLGERVTPVFPGTGKRQWARILDQLACCQPGEKASLDTLKYLPVRLFPSHSLMIIISPLRADDFSAVARLRASGYQVLLVSPNPVQFASRQPHHPLALRAAGLERRVLLWRMREIGAQIIDWPVDQPLSRTVGAFVWREGG